ncbi:hypothetical protein QJS04_geneDACA020797 [Acorus gramineus]|uniref:Bulb-type lectin domain-containing protein n=1 Tax=Acorus gramineus TaxID=55184 RepID=A0AAV9BEW4_ACOGR|nr:hypothetical protein QJS04_geneDACA020797 [Acorus gramineus]
MTWTNNKSMILSVNFSDRSMVRSILLRGGYGPRFACGFYCNGGGCDTYLFAIFIVQANGGSGITLKELPQVVWSANRNHPIKENATLELTRDGDLVLKDVDNTVVWSSNTSRKSVVGLNLT